MQFSYISTQGRITIPAKLRKKFRLKPGTQIEWESRNGRLFLLPVTTRPASKKAIGMIADDRTTR